MPRQNIKYKKFVCKDVQKKKEVKVVKLWKPYI